MDPKKEYFPLGPTSIKQFVVTVARLTLRRSVCSSLIILESSLQTQKFLAHYRARARKVASLHILPAVKKLAMPKSRQADYFRKPIYRDPMTFLQYATCA